MENITIYVNKCKLVQIADTSFLLLINNMSKTLGEENELDQGLLMGLTKFDSD